jgi:hypothetical protein
MPENRREWEEPSGLFRAREDEGSPRHDVGGSINELVTERTEQELPHEVAVLDDDEVEADETEQDVTVAVEVGLDVMGSCGHKIGEVVDVRPDHLVVEKGFLVPEDVYVPKSAIAKADEHHLTLNVSRDVSEHSGWERDPEGIDDEDVIEDADERL